MPASDHQAQPVSWPPRPLAMSVGSVIASGALGRYPRDHTLSSRDIAALTIRQSLLRDTLRLLANATDLHLAAVPDRHLAEAVSVAHELLGALDRDDAARDGLAAQAALKPAVA